LSFVARGSASLCKANLHRQARKFWQTLDNRGAVGWKLDYKVEQLRTGEWFSDTENDAAP
jgi:hypothetical protein